MGLPIYDYLLWIYGFWHADSCEYLLWKSWTITLHVPDHKTCIKTCTPFCIDVMYIVFLTAPQSMQHSWAFPAWVHLLEAWEVWLDPLQDRGFFPHWKVPNTSHHRPTTKCITAVRYLQSESIGTRTSIGAQTMARSFFSWLASLCAICMHRNGH